MSQDAKDGRTDEQTREDRATQPLDAGRLSFAIIAQKLERISK